jgi:PAS domain S-box-containing protein
VYEQEREMLIAQLNADNVLMRQQLSLPFSLTKEEMDSTESIGKLLMGGFPFLSHLPCAFIGLDGQFLDMNSAFLRLTSYSPEFLLQSTMFAITPQHEKAQTAVQLRQLWGGEMDCWESDGSCLVADGTSLPVHLTVTVTKKQGKPEYFTCFFVRKEGVGVGGGGLQGTGGQLQQMNHQHPAQCIHPQRFSLQQFCQQTNQQMQSQDIQRSVGEGEMNQILLTQPLPLTQLQSSDFRQVLSSISCSPSQHPQTLHQLVRPLPMRACQVQTFHMQPHL